MALPTATELHLERLARLRRTTGWIALLVGLPLCFVTLAHGLFRGDELGAFASPSHDLLQIVLLPRSGTFGALVLLALFTLWRMLAWRERALRRAASGSAVPRVSFVGLRLLPVLAIAQHLVALAFGATLILWWREAFELSALESRMPAWLARLPDAVAAGGVEAAERSVELWLGGLLAAASAACALVATYLASVDARLAPEARGAAAWLRLATWIAGLSAAELLASGLELGVEMGFIAVVIGGLTTLLWVELALRCIATTWGRFYSGTPHPGARVYTDAIVPRLLGSTFNPVRSLFAVAAEGFGIDLRGTWALEYMRRSLVPIGGALLVVGWLSTSLHVVPTWSVGVLERFGARPASNDGLLEPGLHLLFPWPIDRVREVEVARVRTLPLGMERPIEGASMLWTVQHAEEEFRLVLGNGNDLLTVNAMLHWRPSDPLKFAYSVANPEQALLELSGRVLFERTVTRTLDDILTGNIEELAEEFEAGIRAAIDEQELGIEIVDLALIALHPPRDVADDYQSVVGAQIEAERLVIEAQSKAETERIRARADANGERSLARGDAIDRLAQATGELEAFASIAEARAKLGHKAILELLIHLDRLHRVLRGRPFTILDERLERDGASWWILDR